MFARKLFQDRFGDPRITRDVAGSAHARSVDRQPYLWVEPEILASSILVFSVRVAHDSLSRRQSGANIKNQ